MSDAASSTIAPCLWFNGEAEEAAEFYISVFPDAKITKVLRYGDNAPFPSGTALLVAFTLGRQRFQALNGGPQYTLSPAISQSIVAKDVTEVDLFWNALTANGGQEIQCGWETDRFGVSWQVVPDGIVELLTDPNSARAGRAMQAMIKLDLETLQTAVDEE